MQKWEYRSVEGWMTQDILNQWGEQGWELIIVDDLVISGSGNRYIFKRPKA
jgi:hypothetical protein